MTFEELWQTLPIPWGYRHMDELDQSRWKAVVVAAFRTGLFEGTHKSASAKTADSKRISDLEDAVSDIRQMLKKQNIKSPIPVAAETDAYIDSLKKELRDINLALDDPRVESEITSVEAIKGLRSALKIIHTWASWPVSFDFKNAQRLCMSALGREQ